MVEEFYSLYRATENIHVLPNMSILHVGRTGPQREAQIKELEDKTMRLHVGRGHMSAILKYGE